MPYNPKDIRALAHDKRLHHNQQSQLTRGSIFKMLETGVLHDGNELNFTIRMSRYYVDEGIPHLVYIDFDIDVFNTIFSKQEEIMHYFRQGVTRTICQKKNIQVFIVAHASKTGFLICFHDIQTKFRVYITGFTFEVLISTRFHVYSEYNKFLRGDFDGCTGNSYTTYNSYDYDSSDSDYY
ncbi:hypothetical protein TKK_0013984 [Trichogramma kaykai]